jgi:hypothetical protein
MRTSWPTHRSANAADNPPYDPPIIPIRIGALLFIKRLYFERRMSDHLPDRIALASSSAEKSPMTEVPAVQFP